MLGRLGFSLFGDGIDPNDGPDNSWLNAVKPIPNPNTFAKNFPIRNYINSLFSNIPNKSNKIISALRPHLAKTAQLVADSAHRLGVKQHHVIRNVLNHLLCYNYADTLFPNRIYISESADTIINHAMQRLTKINNILLFSYTDDLLKNFFNEPTTIYLSKLAKFFNFLEDSTLDPAYMSDWVSIYAFLLHKNDVNPYLDQLEEQLQIAYPFRIKKRKVRSDGKYTLPEDKDNPSQRFHLLSSFLYSWAQDNGFAKRGKLIKGVTSEDFFTLLTTRTFFKDCAIDVGREHGAWSHMLQWYCIFEHDKTTHFLSHNAVHLYEMLGHPYQGIEDASELWVRLFDLQHKPRYISPEFFTTTMANEEMSYQWPLLRDSINRHQKKIATQYGSAQGYRDHLVAKHANKSQNGIVFKRF